MKEERKEGRKKKGGRKRGTQEEREDEERSRRKGWKGGRGTLLLPPREHWRCE